MSPARAPYIRRPHRDRAGARWRPARWRDRGAVTLEAAILAPALLLMIGFAIFAMRVEVAREAVTFAAHDASRIASISRTADEAESNATSTAIKALQNHVPCQGRPVVGVDALRAFRVPVGQPAFVTATVSCTLRLSDLGLPGLPGTITITEQFVSYLDQYRGRS